MFVAFLFIPVHTGLPESFQEWLSYCGGDGLDRFGPVTRFAPVLPILFGVLLSCVWELQYFLLQIPF